MLISSQLAILVPGLRLIIHIFLTFKVTHSTLVDMEHASGIMENVDNVSHLVDDFKHTMFCARFMLEGLDKDSTQTSLAAWVHNFTRKKYEQC